MLCDLSLETNQEVVVPGMFAEVKVAEARERTLKCLGRTSGVHGRVKLPSDSIPCRSDYHMT